jgi:hypothetical protein
MNSDTGMPYCYGTYSVDDGVCMLNTAALCLSRYVDNINPMLVSLRRLNHLMFSFSSSLIIDDSAIL